MMPLEFIPMMDGPPTWATFFNVDAIFLQRAHTPMALDWARAAHDSGVPVVLDYDDDLDHMPPEHVSFHALRHTKAALDELLGLASAVSVSTPALLEVIRERVKGSLMLIPNAVDETLREPAPARPLDPKFYAWRGGMTHREDIELARKLFTWPDVTVHYYGHLPPWVRSGHDMVSPWMPIPTYLEQLRRTPAGAMVVPLIDNAFNRAKSNCIWLEATWAGLATCHCVGLPNHRGAGEGSLPEFNKPGVMSLHQLQTGTSESWNAFREESLAFIQDNLTLARVNPSRRDLLESL
jgi:hypothetical protein